MRVRVTPLLVCGARELPDDRGNHVDGCVGVVGDLGIGRIPGAAGVAGNDRPVDDQIIAPVTAGQPLGSVLVKLGDEVIAEQSLVALDNVGEGSFWQRIVDEAREFISARVETQPALGEYLQSFGKWDPVPFI